jgi:hypothetical protein
MDILHHQYSILGPVYAICIHTEAEPGPPLKEITNGEARSLTSERS